MTLLEEAGINLEYLYDFNTGKSDSAYLILKVKQVEEAAEMLGKSDIRLLDQEDLKNA